MGLQIPPLDDLLGRVVVRLERVPALVDHEELHRAARAPTMRSPCQSIGQTEVFGAVHDHQRAPSRDAAFSSTPLR